MCICTINGLFCTSRPVTGMRDIRVCVCVCDGRHQKLFQQSNTHAVSDVQRCVCVCVCATSPRPPRPGRRRAQNFAYARAHSNFRRPLPFNPNPPQCDVHAHLHTRIVQFKLWLGPGGHTRVGRQAIADRNRHTHTQWIVEGVRVSLARSATSRTHTCDAHTKRNSETDGANGV